MIRKLLFTVNDGNYLHPVHRESFVDASQRWGCDYLEIPGVPGYHSCFARHLFLSGCKTWDRAVWIDGDCLIRDTAPNPFSITDPSRVWGVRDINSSDASESQIQEITQNVHRYWFDILESPSRECRGGVQQDVFIKSFINGGLVICSPKIHENIFRLFETIASEQSTHDQRQSAHYEQSLFNYCIHLARQPIAHLGREWNHLSPPGGNAIREGDHVWHFSGLDAIHQKTRIGKVGWRSA